MTQHRDFSNRRTTLRRKSSWVLIGISFVFPFVFLWWWLISMAEPDISEKIARLIDEELEREFGPSNFAAYPSSFKQPDEFLIIGDMNSTSSLLRNSTLLFAYPPLRSKLDEHFLETKPIVDQWYQAMKKGSAWQSHIDPMNYYGLDFLFIQQISKLYAASALNHASIGNWELAFSELKQGRDFNSPLLSSTLISHLIYQSNLSIQVDVLEEMIRWNPSDEVLLQISKELDEIAALNQPVPVISYISEFTTLNNYVHQNNSKRNDPYILITGITFENYANQLLKATNEISFHEMQNPSFGNLLSNRANRLSWTGLPAVLHASEAAFVPFHDEINAIELPSKIEASLTPEEAYQFRKSIFCNARNSNEGEQNNLRKFRKTKVVILKLHIAAILYHRENGKWPTDFTQLPSEVISPADFKNKTGLFSPDEIFQPLIMKSVSLVPDLNNPQPVSTKPDEDLERFVIDNIEPLLLGEQLVYKSPDSTNYSVRYSNITDETLSGTLTIDNSTRNHQGYSFFNPLKMQAVAHILKTNRKNLVSSITVHRIQQKILSSGQIITQESKLLTEQQLAEDQKAYDDFDETNPNGNVYTQGNATDRIKENNYLITSNIHLPRNVFAIYSVGVDGQDNGGIRDYRHYTNIKSANADIVTYLFSPDEATGITPPSNSPQ